MIKRTSGSIAATTFLIAAGLVTGPAAVSAAPLDKLERFVSGHVVDDWQQAPSLSKTSAIPPVDVAEAVGSANLGKAPGVWQATDVSGVELRRTAPGSAKRVQVRLVPPSQASGASTSLRVDVTRLDGAGAPGVETRVAPSVLNRMFGGNYASRVRWQPVKTSPSAANQTSFVAQSTTEADDGSGTFGATPLKPSSTWQVSAQTGAFTYNYPLRVPPVGGDFAPQLALSYNSAAVDGATAATNNQPTPVGEGWSVSGGGFIERSYTSCDDDGKANSGDFCWKNGNATMSFAGASGRLIPDADEPGLWRLEDDNGWRIRKLTGASNGDEGTAGVDGAGEHWEVTTREGTRYYFGLNRLPGWTDSDRETRSTLTVPVFGNNSGEPCYRTPATSAYCKQAWRWNLDYAVSTRGQSQALFYEPEDNRYLLNNTTKVLYQRAAQLKSIEYGTINGSAIKTPAPARVSFTYKDRCNETGATCIDSHPARASDVPWDLQCDADDACTGHNSPAFFTQNKLTSILAEANPSGTWVRADRWALTHTFPPPGGNDIPALWLQSVQHYGLNDSAYEPATSFGGDPMPNRVKPGFGATRQWKYRLNKLTTQLGAVTTVVYSEEECTAAQPSPASNSKKCFPQWWTPPAHEAVLDWFNKYAVVETSTTNTVAGDTPEETRYDYIGAAGWRYDTAPTTPESKRTWNDFAGYSQVRVRHGGDGNPAAQETSTVTYFQGMFGDRLSATGGTRDTKVGASDGSPAIDDNRWWAGRVREEVVHNGNSGPRDNVTSGAWLSKTVYTPWADQTTANGGRTAHAVGDLTVKTYTPVAGSTPRQLRTTNTFDEYGRITAINDVDESAENFSYSHCSRTKYADNVSAWILSTPYEIIEVGKACGQPTSFPADAVTAQRTYYDESNTLGAAPSHGSPTRVDVIKGYTGTTQASATWIASKSIDVDTLGRPVRSIDKLKTPDTTATMTYVPEGAGIETSLAETNELGWISTSYFEPRWGSVTKLEDANGRATEAQYDGLGRQTKFWRADRPRTDYPTSPSESFAYAVSNVRASVVATTTLTPGGGTVTTRALYDGLGRIRQTQEPSPIAGRIIEDTLYDGAGRVYSESTAYHEASAPSNLVFDPDGSVLPGEVRTEYDSVGRTKKQTQIVLNAVKSTTNFVHGGNSETVLADVGGTSSTTITDARGQVREIRRLHTPAANSTYDSTSYEYFATGKLAVMTDALENRWEYTYDVAGRETSAKSPDGGTTLKTYDDAGQVTRARSPRGNWLAFTYDATGRMTGKYADTTVGTKLAAWSYDPTIGGVQVRGYLAQSTQYVGGVEFAVNRIAGYDAAYRVTSQETEVLTGKMKGVYRTNTGYGQDGQTTFIGHNAYAGIGGDGVFYEFDELGNPSSAKSGSSLYYINSTTRNYLGQVGQLLVQNGSTSLKRSFIYEEGTNRLLTDSVANTTGGGTVVSHQYAYNASGQLTRDANTTASGTDVQCFEYDFAQRVKEAWTPPSSTSCTAPKGSLAGPAPYWQSFDYDAIGNRAKFTDRQGGTTRTATYTYPSSGATAVGPHQVRSIATTTGTQTSTEQFNYLSDGALETRKILGSGPTFEYDIEGRVTKAATSQGESSFVYNVDSSLLQRQNADGSTTLFVGDTEVSARSQDSAPTSLVRTYYFNKKPVAERVKTATNATPTVRWLFADPRGTAEAAVDTTTASRSVYFRDPFGKDRGATVLSPSGHGFLNATTNASPGVLLLGVRNYDPSLGRFLSLDSIVDPKAPEQNNGYSYAFNNPVLFADPTGLRPAGDIGDVDAGNWNNNRPAANKETENRDFWSRVTVARARHGCSSDVQCNKGGPVISHEVCYSDACGDASKQHVICDRVSCDWVAGNVWLQDGHEYTLTDDWLKGSGLGDALGLVQAFKALGGGAIGGVLARALGGDAQKNKFILELSSGQASVWTLPPTVRGRVLEVLFGAPGDSSKTIDVYDPGSKTAQSIKTLDLKTSKTYQDPARLRYAIKRYIDAVSSYPQNPNGETWNGVRLKPGDVKDRQLLLIVPSYSGTPEQLKVLASMKAYAHNVAGVYLDIRGVA